MTASMRPRVFPAEDSQDVVKQGAAAKASMRPRVFPAEDFSSRYDQSRTKLLQ